MRRVPRQPHTGIEDMTDNSRSPVPCVQILRLPQVCKATGLGRSMIYQLESERRFPCRVRIGARAVGWVEAEVQSWLAGRVEHYRVAERCKAARAAAMRESPCQGAKGLAPGKVLNKQLVDSQLFFAASRNRGQPAK